MISLEERRNGRVRVGVFGALNDGKNVNMPRKKDKPDDPAQYKRFLEAAKEADADETKEGADKAFKKVVLPKHRKPNR